MVIFLSRGHNFAYKQLSIVLKTNKYDGNYLIVEVTYKKTRSTIIAIKYFPIHN